MNSVIRAFNCVLSLPLLNPGCKVSLLSVKKNHFLTMLSGAWRSLVAHSTGGRKVAGSSPAAPTIGLNDVSGRSLGWLATGI